MKQKGVLIVVSGFAGTGKGTLMKRLLSDYDTYALSVSMTTRSPRPGEEHGREYFFVTKEEFEKKIEEGGLIEHACYCDNYYGTPRDYVEQKLEEGKNVILEIEVQGALKVKERFPDSILIYVLPPSIPELEKRLIGRGTETPEVIHRRLSRATEEIREIQKYDYIVVNDDLDRCVVQLHSIISSAQARPYYHKEFISRLADELAVLMKGE
ncbi:MAG: guanylate kinase [Lachnospiraceae bacterium]|nr:guanylate kinase [Lachnospiraceae bacterium]